MPGADPYFDVDANANVNGHTDSDGDAYKPWVTNVYTDAHANAMRRVYTIADTHANQPDRDVRQ